MNGNPATLIPVALFLLLGLGITFFVRYQSRKRRETGFVSEYFIGSRSLGAFVLAMTTIATYGSVSSFVGGPGQAWNVGFGWVYMATIQVTALFLLYGIMGKKMALVSRKLGAITVIDVIRARYQSNALANISAIVIVLFFGATMVAQFVGGAKLFEAVTGYSYEVGLAIFGIAAILFTALGGFRGVAFGYFCSSGWHFKCWRWIYQHYGKPSNAQSSTARSFRRRRYAYWTIFHSVVVGWCIYLLSSAVSGSLHGVQRL